MEWRLIGWAAGIALASLPLAGAEAASPAQQLAPNRAVYDMSLSNTRPGSGVTGASGVMSYKFGDTCDGWTVENRTALTFAYNDGAPVATTWDFVTWESKDGLHYRFRVRSTRDGAVTEEINGVATLDGKGKGGVVKYSQPEQKTLRLPKGTLFPTEHTVRLLEAAQRGEKIMGRLLFDGTGTDGVFDVNAVIGRQAAAKTGIAPVAANPAINQSLLTAPSWPMQMAFFVPDANEATPDYEIALRYYINGVADDVVQSFGNFSLKGTLQTLEALPKPDC